MNTVPIAFFQAAATAIPTLLIALVIASKMGHEIAAAAKTGGKAYLVLLTIAGLLLAVLVTAAEILALAGTVAGGGSAAQACIVAAGIIAIIYMLLFEVAGPLSDNFSSEWASNLVLAIIPVLMTGMFSWFCIWVFLR